MFGYPFPSCLHHNNPKLDFQTHFGIRLCPKWHPRSTKRGQLIASKLKVAQFWIYSRSLIGFMIDGWSIFCILDRIVSKHFLWIEDSDKIYQDLQSSSKINRRNGKHKPAGVTCRNGSRITRTEKWGSGGDSPHGVFNINEMSPTLTYLQNKSEKQYGKILKVQKSKSGGLDRKSTSRGTLHRGILNGNILIRIILGRGPLEIKIR